MTEQPQPQPQRKWYNIPGHMYDLTRTTAGQGQLMIYTSLILFVLGIGGKIDEASIVERDKVTPENQRFGWNEVAAKQEAPAIAAQMQKFAITDANGNRLSGAGKNAELWKFAKIASGGKHIPTWRQESGDCVSMGWSNAVAYRQAFQIASENKNEVLKIPFPPFMYGVSRVLIGKRQLGRGAGSIGAWAAQGSITYGVLPVDQAELFGFKYSGRLADDWGWNGVPNDTLKFAKDFRIKTVSQAKSWEDVRDALVHGYPVTVASNVGFEGGSYDNDGKRWLRPAGNWGHQMCFIGVEDRPKRIKGAYIINSWGASAHPKPIGDEPPGGFWVDWQTVQRMVGQGDSWAYSDFDGFPGEAVADWDSIKADLIETGGSEAQNVIAVAETPEREPVLMETRKMLAPMLSGWLIFFGVVLLFGGLLWKHGKKSTVKTLATLLMCVGVIGLGFSAEAGPRARRFQYQSSGGNCVNGVCTAPSIASQSVAPVAKPAPAPAAKPVDKYAQDKATGEVTKTTASGEIVHLVVLDTDETVAPRRRVVEYISRADLKKISGIEVTACKCGPGCKCSAPTPAVIATPASTIGHDWESIGDHHESVGTIEKRIDFDLFPLKWTPEANPFVEVSAYSAADAHAGWQSIGE